MTDHHDLGPTARGSVIANVGGGHGALVLYTPDSLAGAEIDIVSVETGVRTHVAVRERRLQSGRVYAAFYPLLPAGQYVVSPDGSPPTDHVTIVGGQVATVDWRSPSWGRHCDSA